jgi:hypothetical protein
MRKKLIIGVSCSIILIFAVTSIYLFYFNKKPTTTVYINPETIKGTIGQVFIVNISVSDVSDLYGWEVKLGWNATVLDVVEVYEGPFLKSTGDTFFTYSVNTTAGYIILDCTLLGDLSGASGSGVLVSIQFNVKKSGSCSLQLSETVLVNSSEELIQHAVGSGQFTT